MFLILAFALRPYLSRIAGMPDASALAHLKAVPA
jgi:hypothetical protein